MNEVRDSIVAVTSFSSSQTKEPDSTFTPRDFSRPTPGPASWRSKPAENKPCMFLSDSSACSSQFQIRASSKPFEAAF